MTHDTDEATERANRYPDDADAADIEAALRGRRLFKPRLGQKIDGCRRCQEKNTKRHFAGVDRVDATFDDGDDVTIHAVHDSASAGAGPHWLITAAAHREHPQLPFDDVASRGTDLVRAHARIREREHTHIVDVDVIERSPMDAGPATSVVEQREQEHIDDGAPMDAVVIDRDPDDAPAHWPDADRQWLDKLASTFELQMPTFDVGEQASGDANPWGNSR